MTRSVETAVAIFGVITTTPRRKIPGSLSIWFIAGLFTLAKKYDDGETQNFFDKAALNKSHSGADLSERLPILSQSTGSSECCLLL